MDHYEQTEINQLLNDIKFYITGDQKNYSNTLKYILQRIEEYELDNK